MKKTFVKFLTLASVAGMVVFGSCGKKDDVVPAVVAKTFDTEVSGKVVYSNLSTVSTSAANVGSFYSFSDMSASYSAARMLDTSGSFQFVASGSSSTTYMLKNTATFLAGSPNFSRDNEILKMPVTFAATSMNYTTANADSVSKITSIATASISIISGQTILFKTSSGKVGLLYATLANDGGATPYAYMAFKYKYVK